MSLTERQLIALLRLALTGEQEAVLSEHIDWEAIREMAEQQSVLGITFAGIERLPRHMMPAMPILMDWVGQAEKIKTQNLHLNKKCKQATSIFRKEGFRTSIMKGQGNALLYHTQDANLSMLRSSGDIDLWVEGGMEKVNAFVQEISPTNEINELEIQFHGVKGATVEVHFRPFYLRNPWHNARLQKFFEEEADSCYENKVDLEIEGGKTISTYVTTTRFNVIHQLAHIYIHLLTEGIGMRQLIDYFFVLKDFAKESEDTRIATRNVIESIGLTRFAAALSWIMSDALGLPKEMLLVGPHAKDGRFLLNEVINSGNFGRANGKQKEKKGKRGYTLWMILFRNLRYWRFDHTEWLWGPLWRIYHRAWRLVKGYR